MPHLQLSLRRLLSAATSLLLLIEGGAAIAACAQADVGGSWQVYAIDIDYTPGFKPQWIRCSLQIKPNGVFDNVASSCANNVGQGANVFGLIRLIGTQQCIFNGYIYVNGTRAEFTRATMNRSKDHVDGVGTYQQGILFYSLTKP